MSALLAHVDLVGDIGALRRALAFEAVCLEAHLGYKSFPEKHRADATVLVERMRAAARGQAHEVFGDAARPTDRAERATAEALALRSTLESVSMALAMYLMYSSFPTRRRAIAELQAARIHRATREVHAAYANVKWPRLMAALVAADAPTSFSVESWTAERA